MNSAADAAITFKSGSNVGVGTTASIRSCNTKIALSFCAEAANSVSILLARSCL